MRIEFDIPDDILDSLVEVAPRFYGVPDMKPDSNPLTTEQLTEVKQTITDIFSKVDGGDRYYVDSLLDWLLNGE